MQEHIAGGKEHNAHGVQKKLTAVTAATMTCSFVQITVLMPNGDALGRGQVIVSR